MPVERVTSGQGRSESTSWVRICWAPASGVEAAAITPSASAPRVKGAFLRMSFSWKANLESPGSAFWKPATFSAPTARISGWT